MSVDETAAPSASSVSDETAPALKRSTKRFLAWGTVIVIVGVFTGCNALITSGHDHRGTSEATTSDLTAMHVSRANFEAEGKMWPLTVASGVVDCRPGNEIIFTSAGKTYALNGLAKDEGKWADIMPIWADDGSGLDLRLNISDLIDKGQSACD